MRTPIALLQSASAASASQVWRVVVTLGTHILLRRLIAPEEMGVWNWAEPLFILLAQVRDLGLTGHLVRLRKRPYGTFLRLELWWGAAFSFLVLVAAPVLALLFLEHDRQTVQIVRALCLFLFIQGLAAVPLTYFEAEQKLIKTIPAELVRNLAFAALSLLLVVGGLGIWGLVVAHIVAGAIYAAVLWRWAWPDLRHVLDHEAVRPLVTAALPLALMSLLELSVLYLEPLILGVGLPDEAALARASLAIQALYFFSRMIADAVGRAVYPALVRYRSDIGRSFDVFRLATLALAGLFVPASFCFFLNAEVAVKVLGGSAWAGAATYLRVAAFVPFVRPLTMFGRELLLTVHRDRLLITYTLANLLSLGGLGYVLVRSDMREIGMAVASYFPLGTLILGWGLFDLDRRGFVKLMGQLLELYVFGALCFAPVLLTPADPSWMRVAASCLAGAIFVGVAGLRHRTEFLAFVRSDEPAGDG